MVVRFPRVITQLVSMTVPDGAHLVHAPLRLLARQEAASAVMVRPGWRLFFLICLSRRPGKITTSVGVKFFKRQIDGCIRTDNWTNSSCNVYLLSSMSKIISQPPLLTGHSGPSSSVFGRPSRGYSPGKPCKGTIPTLENSVILSLNWLVFTVSLSLLQCERRPIL